MAIDPNTESLLSLTEAAKLLPRRRGGKRPHVSCLYRWTKTGCKGVLLESIQIDGTRCVSKEGLARFFHALTQANGPGPLGQRLPSRTRRSETERELDAAGI